MRALHWLAAVELAGGAARFRARSSSGWRRRSSPTAAFSTTHLENRGMVPANHLLGN